MQKAGVVQRRRGLFVALMGVIVTLPVVGVAAKWVHAAFTHPLINDISTDLGDPPAFRHMPRPAAYPGADVAAVQARAYPDIAPLQLAQPASAVFRYVRELVQDRRWEIVSEDEAELHVEATEKSRLFGFVDEIVLRMTETADGTRVDMRSRSRLGRGDLGVNAARIRDFLADLELRVESAPRA